MAKVTMRQLAQVIANAIDPKIQKMAAALVAMQKEVKELRREVAAKEYKGVWQEGQYEKGNLITHGGSMWIALKDSQDKPGTRDAWQLAVKRGRDGRNTR